MDTSIRATLDRVGDIDYYCVVVHDGANVPGFGENFVVTLSDVPAGRDYDIYLYSSVENCRDNNALDSSINGGSQDENIHWDERQPGNDNGIFVIKVTTPFGAQSCDDEYLLTVRGLN